MQIYMIIAEHLFFGEGVTCNANMIIFDLMLLFAVACVVRPSEQVSFAFRDSCCIVL